MTLPLRGFNDAARCAAMILVTYLLGQRSIHAARGAKIAGEAHGYCVDVFQSCVIASKAKQSRRPTHRASWAEIASLRSQ
jgi:hypothetical protein